MNEEIVENIEKIKKEQITADERKKITWLMFSINEKKYAIESSAVLEIIRDVQVYKLPFLPSYIEGVINRRGDPFTVLNPLIAIGADNINTIKEPLFLILKRDDDQVSLHISDILFFYDIDEKDLHIIPNNDENGFFIGTIDYNKEEIPVFNPNAFELLLRKDLGK